MLFDVMATDTKKTPSYVIKYGKDFSIFIWDELI